VLYVDTRYNLNLRCTAAALSEPILRPLFSIVYAYNQDNREVATATSADSATAATAAILQQQLLLLRTSTAPAVRAVL
jgi:hypothetical protein